MKDRVTMKDGTVLHNVHTEDQCAGQHCVIHNPSDHHMGDWPHNWNDITVTMWRVCHHELLHPDPDDLNYHRARFGDAQAAGAFVHLCDSCCQPPRTITLPAEVVAFLEDPSRGELRGRPRRQEIEGGSDDRD